MPTPPTARRLSTRNTPQTTPSKHAAGAAAAAALRSNTPTSVKDRIRQWQDQGGGVLPATTPTRPGKTSSSSSLSSIDNAEVAEPISTRIPENDSIPKAEPAKTTPKKAATVRRWADPAAGQWVREKPRSSSTPRKRVISDEHWKKNRAGSPKVGESAPGTPRARARTRRLQSQEQSSPQYHTPERDATQTKKRSSAGRRSSGREALDTKEEEDSVRVTGASSGSRKISYEDDIVVELESTIIGYNKTDRSASPSPPPKRKSSARHQDKENYLPTEDDGRGRRKTSYAEALEVASQVADGSLDKSGSQRSRKGGILGQIFSRSEPAPAPAPRVPTIEAWLDDQTDPFIDNSEPQVDVPAPLQTRPSRRRVSKEPVIPEDETLREPCDHETELKQRESHRRRRRRTRPSLESTEAKTRQSPQTEVQQDQTPSETAFGKDYAAENSPSTLRRRGAARGDRSRSRKRLSAAVNAQDSPASQMASPLSSPKETEQHVDQLKDLSGSRRRRPPTGGRQLSTIESIASAETCPSNVDPDQSYVALMAQGPTELKRRLTTHEDLISVLSMPRGNSRKIRSARSVRGTRPDPRSKEINPILQSLAEEEEKYMRELKTLVDGVIPVLLQCMLSKSDMSAAAGLFGATSGQDTAAITKPIMDMGITLERIKALHKRIPMRDANSLLSWAQGANKVYIDYIRAWRMGFQDVVINLAPAENAKQNDAQSEGGMARDSEGDVIDAEGKKADVAHLLKRPLVRLKHLSKTFQQLSEALATPRAEATHKDYLDLVELARRRSNEERARLEDEAAAAIDPTKARDSRSLAILPGVTIDKTRKVRARDYFDLTLHHSSGQRIDCQAELLLRENQTQDGPGGDVLLCEIDVRSRWLLFPPLELQCLSARAGDIPGEIVVMIRGASTYNGAWHELVSLRTEDEETLREWLQMLGSDPYPPKMVRSQSFINRQKETSTGDAYVPTKSAAHLSRTPSPTEVDVPIGEPSVISMHREVGRHEESHPVPPPHGSPTASEIGLQNVPVLKAQPSSSPEKTLRRRSSSPLKHEYAPSTSSNSLSDSDFDSDSTSDTSEDELEAEDIPGPLIPLGSAKRKHHSMPPPSRPTLAGGTLAPSDSASQAPYRTVPVQDPKTSAKTIATAFYWSDKGCWNPIHPDESSIIVSPGLIEVYEMTAAHSGAGFQSPDLSSRSTTDASGIERPLIGLELTPLVPLRRGTALDISIRSPPVERSRFKGSNNIMLRSRNTDECDVLYAMINHARINNPTYIALQNARPSYQPPVSFNTGGTQGARHSQGYKRPTSWFGGGRGSKPSYRASSAPTGPSIGAGSENSVGTVTSALRRLSGSGVFNLSRSSVLKKANRASAATSSLYSSDSGGTGGGPGSGTATPTGHGEASMGGVNNLKIRLYIREDQNKWRDIGAARLTILPGDSVTSPPATPGMQSPPPTGTGSGPSTPQLNRTRTEGPRLASATFSPHRSHGNPVQEKRVLITSSKKTPTAITLLDVTLHESCFERVARTGIAVSVWEEHQEGIVKEGGVNPGKAKVYMVQCAGEAEAAWVFNLVGRARY
ncbi:hypothetical protein UCRPC4_g03082 [Phaeomoniella chlamydospora]|uniref:Uncharacterized protein n=1 Tax=Phaeomoniella chlamydospora TaxID=158046 RepID=A0A0G2EIT7_PHACM|nr:hypothetical protein UCRPC4_g03082 [Phaeomoniella chlamydospora]